MHASRAICVWHEIVRFSAKIVWNVTSYYDDADDANELMMLMLLLQDKLLAKMDNEEEEKMSYSADDQVTPCYNC